MSDTESTCLDYIMQCGIKGRESEQINQYYKERGILDEMLENADKAISALAELSVRQDIMNSEVSDHE